MAKKKSKKQASPKKDGAGIFSMWVDDVYTGKKVVAVNSASAVERYIKENPQDAGRKIEAKRDRGCPPVPYDCEAVARGLERIEQAEKEITGR